jgi:Uma2 family endonuclease
LTPARAPPSMASVMSPKAYHAARTSDLPGLRAVERGAFPPQGEWTYEDYRRLPDDGWRYEVVRGELHMAPAPSSKHQATVRNLAFLFMLHLRENRAGRIYFSPLDVILPAGLATPVQPDLIFISEERRAVVREQSVEGAPDLIAEVLSPSNWLDDRRTKFGAYAEAGVREYWLLDPRDETVEVYVLRGGIYELLDRFAPGTEIHSEVLPGFTPSVDEMFAD